MLKHEEYRKLIPQEEVILTKNFKLEIKLPIPGPRIWNLDVKTEGSDSQHSDYQILVRSVDWINNDKFLEISDLYNLFVNNSQKIQSEKYKTLLSQIENFQFTQAIKELKTTKISTKAIRLNSLSWMIDVLVQDMTNFLWIEDSNSPLLRKKLNDFCNPNQTYWGALIHNSSITVGTKSYSKLDIIAETTKRNLINFNPLDFQVLLKEFQEEKMLNFIIKLCRIRCYQNKGDFFEAIKRINELPKVYPKNKTILEISNYVKTLLNQTYAPSHFKAPSTITSLMEIFPNHHTICGWSCGNDQEPKQVFKMNIAHFDLTQEKFIQSQNAAPNAEIILNDLSKTLVFKGSEFSYENKPLLYQFIKIILLKRTISYNDLVKDLGLNGKQSNIVIDNLFSRVKSDFLGLIQNKNNIFTASSRPTFIVETNVGYS